MQLQTHIEGIQVRGIGASLIIFLTSVLGISGSVLLLYIKNTPLNVGSYTGTIMIVGIIAGNAIFTYYQFQQAYETENMKLNDAILSHCGCAPN